MPVQRDALTPEEPEVEPSPSAGACPVCGETIAEQATICVNCGYNRRTGRKLSARAAVDAETLRGEQQRRLQNEYVLREYHLPTGLLVVGLVLNAMLRGWAGGDVLTIASVLIIETGVGVLITIPALYVAAYLLGLEFGRLHTAMLKIGAIYIFPNAIGLGVGMLVGFWFIGWVVAVGLYFMLLCHLFELELDEAFICAVIIFFVRLLIVVILMALLM
jgi:hypothetical protein